MGRTIVPTESFDDVDIRSPQETTHDSERCKYSDISHYENAQRTASHRSSCMARASKHYRAHS